MRLPIYQWAGIVGAMHLCAPFLELGPPDAGTPFSRFVGTAFAFLVAFLLLRFYLRSSYRRQHQGLLPTSNAEYIVHIKSRLRANRLRIIVIAAFISLYAIALSIA